MNIDVNNINNNKNIDENNINNNNVIEKTGRNQSKIKVHLAKRAAELGISPTLTTMSVKVGLRSALSHHSNKTRKKYEQYFEDRARSLGCWRSFISLYAGYRYASCVESGDKIPLLTKTFFDKCWSATDHIRMNMKVRSTDEIKPMKRFISETKFPINDLPERMSGEYELRSPIARDMFDTTKTFITTQFPKQVYAVGRFEIIRLNMGITKKNITRLSSSVYRCILCDQIDLNSNIASLLEITNELDLLTTDIISVQQIYQTHRTRLMSLHEYNDKDIKGNCKWIVAMKNKPDLVIPYLAKVSQDYELFWKDLDDIGRYQAKCDRIPQPFSLIPVWKCDPVYVDFAATQMKLLYTNFDGLNKPKLDPFNLDEGDLKLFDLSAIPQIRRRNMNRISKGNRGVNWDVTGLSTNGVELVVKMSAFKEQVSERINHTTNREYLFKAGYDIPKPKSNVTVATERGVFKVSEKRYDVLPLMKEEHESGLSKKVEIVCIDPGCSDVISVRQGTIDGCANAAEIVKNSNAWSVSNKIYQTMVGAGQLTSLECGRRNINKKYGTAIHELENSRRRSAIPSTIQAYIEKLRPYLKAYMTEVTSRYRRYINWQVERRRSGVIDNLANMIFGQVSANTEDKLMRHVNKYKVDESWEPRGKGKDMSDGAAKRKRRESERFIECRTRLQAVIKETKERERPTKRICFFGDGSFKAMRGNAPVPRKALVRALARRGLTFILDEFRTSARCPGCGSEMKDDDKGHRIRQCTSIDDSSNEQNSDTCLLHSKGEIYRGDRDEVATVNMMMCAVSALGYGIPKHQRRPAHLCRTKTKLDKLDNLIYDTGNVS